MSQCRELEPARKGRPPKSYTGMQEVYKYFGFTGVRRFTDLKQIAGIESTVFLRPSGALQTNLTAVDSLTTGGDLFQATVSDKHDISGGLLDVLDALPEIITAPRLYFVVPNKNVFQKWRWLQPLPDAKVQCCNFSV